MLKVGAAAPAFAIFCLTLANGTCDFLRKSSSISFFTKLFRWSPIFFVSEFYNFTATGWTLKLQVWSRFANAGLLSIVVLGVPDFDRAFATWTDFAPPFGSCPNASNLLERLNFVFISLSAFASAYEPSLKWPFKFVLYVELLRFWTFSSVPRTAGTSMPIW